jgi:hypothetical protein
MTDSVNVIPGRMLLCNLGNNIRVHETHITQE